MNGGKASGGGGGGGGGVCVCECVCVDDAIILVPLAHGLRCIFTHTLCHTILYHTIPYHTIPYHTISYYVATHMIHLNTTFYLLNETRTLRLFHI